MDIHLFWQGPLSVEDVRKLTNPSDYGVYQIYGIHPTYGRDVLLYIGKAAEQTFAKRIGQHRWVQEGHEVDEMKIYVGRLAGETEPDAAMWNEMVDHAEALRINAHLPAYNSKNTRTALKEEKIVEAHVLNWEAYNRLFPEVSYKRFTGKYDYITEDHIFEEEQD